MHCVLYLPKASAQLLPPYLNPDFFAFFPLHLSSAAPATKRWCQVIRSAAPATQNHFPKTEDLMLQNATPLRKSAPWPPNSSDEHVSCTAPATRNASCHILCICPTPAIVFETATKRARFARTYQSATNSSVFSPFDFEMCFAPQRRALFRPLSFQKWSEPVVFCTFWLGNVLCATTACTFSTSQLQKVLTTWCVLCILTWKCASRHNSVQLFISHLTRCAFHLCFSSVHIVGSLTSKLPSIIISWKKLLMFLRPAYFLKDASAATKTIELRGIPSWMVPWWSLAAGNMRRCQRGRVSMSYQVCNM